MLAVIDLPSHVAARLTEVEGHWFWDGKPNGQGYGRYGQTLAHRLIWELLVGPIPEGTILHHACPYRMCCRPDSEHVTPTTRSEHPDNRPHQLAARTLCDHGHPFDGWRQRADGRGERYCRTCNAAGERRRQGR